MATDLTGVGPTRRSATEKCHLRNGVRLPATMYFAATVPFADSRTPGTLFGIAKEMQMPLLDTLDRSLADGAEFIRTFRHSFKLKANASAAESECVLSVTMCSMATPFSPFVALAFSHGKPPDRGKKLYVSARLCTGTPAKVRSLVAIRCYERTRYLICTRTMNKMVQARRWDAEPERASA